MTTERERQEPVFQRLRKHMQVVMEAKTPTLKDLSEDLLDLMAITNSDVEIAILALFIGIVAKTNDTKDPKLYRMLLAALLENQ